MTTRPTIREAGRTDAPAIARLAIRECVRHVRADCSPAGFRLLLATLVARATQARLDDAAYRYWIAADGDELVGLCALRDTTHLYHLFVASERHGEGTGSRLWNTARTVTGSAEYTVNASTFAVPVYRRLGFKAAGGALTANGVRSWPMRLRCG